VKKYNILVIGIECYFGHIKEFVINLKKKNPLVEISLVTSPISDDDRSELDGVVIRVVQHRTYNGRIKLRYFVMLMNVLYYCFEFFGLLLRGHYDIVDIHFPNRHIKFAMPFIKMMTKNIVITPWGSDVLRVENEKSIKELGQIYSVAKYVTVSKDSQIGQCMMEKFKVNPEKMVKLGWGGEFFDFIQENSSKVTTEEAKDRFGLCNKYVITCGYNTQREQRHEDIIDAVYSVRNQLPDNLVLLFPFTYGRTTWSDEYTESLKEKCKELGLDFVAVEEHLDMLDLLKLRMATDIFVHVQTTDAGSRCVMEYVACNKKVVHGAWIRYAYMEKYKPSCYFPVDNLENLGECIKKAYNNQIEALPREVVKVIMERGWNYKMALWNEFFESLV
jgi:hypothetical protein